MTKEDEEYEVESIVAARLERKRGKKPTAQWRYRVRWKGYNPNQDTWEPQESFSGSEDIIERFWERANTEGRDYRDVSVFKAGEEFLPLGPPRRKQRRKSGETGDSATHLPGTPSTSRAAGRGAQESDLKVSGSNQKRKSLSPALDVHQPPAKRLREQQLISRITEDNSVPQTTKLLGTAKTTHSEYNVLSSEPHSSQPRPKRRRTIRTPSPEVIPDSDEDTPVVPTPHSISNSPASASKMTSLTTSNIPYHRMRAAVPLVRSLGEDRGSLESISRSNPAEPTSQHHHTNSKKLGPPSRSQALKKSRSSLLTAEKGILRSVKGKYVVDALSRKDGTAQNSADICKNTIETVDDTNSSALHVPVTGEELLSLAGLNEKTTDDLSDFEEGGMATDRTALPSMPANMAGTSNVASSLYNSQLFPSGPSSLAMPISRSLKTMTIFGSLGFEHQSKSSQVVESSVAQNSEGYPLLLVLDTSVSFPVVLTDASPTPGFASELQRLVGSNGPPGKFYKPDDAHSLISTLRTVGPSGKIMINKNASEENKQHFQRLLSRLDKDELFIALVGTYLLAFCSPISETNTMRLNIPSQLVISSQGHILVTRVEVDNYSQYADLAIKADNTRWIHYIADLEN
ncbi:hypothetical protein BDQ17DRAFT_1341700 [Cyathus striatus]|nr:hypothetical protein BDQ17DRAFT_1341700 [Cyathus striatus]